MTEKKTVYLYLTVEQAELMEDLLRGAVTGGTIENGEEFKNAVRMLDRIYSELETE